MCTAQAWGWMLNDLKPPPPPPQGNKPRDQRIDKPSHLCLEQAEFVGRTEQPSGWNFWRRTVCGVFTTGPPQASAKPMANPHRVFFLYRCAYGWVWPRRPRCAGVLVIPACWVGWRPWGRVTCWAGPVAPPHPAQPSIAIAKLKAKAAPAPTPLLLVAPAPVADTPEAKVGVPPPLWGRSQWPVCLLPRQTYFFSNVGRRGGLAWVPAPLP